MEARALWERKPGTIPKKEHLLREGSLPPTILEEESEHELTESTSESSTEMAEVKHDDHHKGGVDSPKPLPNSAVGKYTIPIPFCLATEKRALLRALDSRIGISRKQENDGQVDGKKLYKEGTSCSRTILDTKSTSTPVFHCEERARNREKFLLQLEAKHKSLEAERSIREAKSKEEKEAAVKQLRRSLNFKATPMPNFYHEVKKKNTPALIIENGQDDGVSTTAMTHD